MLYPHKIQAQTKTGGGVEEGWVGLGRVGLGCGRGVEGGCNNVLVFWVVMFFFKYAFFW